MTNPSWQADPSGRHELRWWDGQRWTDHVNDHGLTSADPLQPYTPPAVVPPAVAPSAEPPRLQPPTFAQPTIAQPTIAQPTIAQPTIAQPLYPPTVAQPAYGIQQQWAAAPPPLAPNHTPLIVGGVVAVLAIGVGAFFLLKGDDTPGNTIATTIPDTTEVVDTTTPLETTTEVPTTAPGPTVSGDLLVAMLPADADVPADWTRYSDADPAPTSQSGPGTGFCGLTNSVGRAQLAGSTAQGFGPGWDLPDQSSFTADLYAFADVDSASSFLTAILKDANSCTGNPVRYTMSEADAQWFDDDGSLDATQWSIEEQPGATANTDTKAAESVQAFVDERYTTTVDSTDYAVTGTSVMLYERWGKYVISFSLYGRWGYTGWPDASPYEHQPTIAELSTAANLVRDTVLKRLAAAGLI